MRSLEMLFSLLAFAVAAQATSFNSTAPTVTVLNGTYEGLYLPSFHQDLFLGIPYAQDTSNQNRFRIPQALNETWTGTRLATNYSEACPDISPSDWTYGVGENCLSINVIRPAGLDNTSNLPTVTWIHGGSYQTGTSSLPDYNLTYIVQRSVEIGKPIVATSINYRKGGWGMLYSREVQGAGQANLSLRDMRKGLAWIQENISAFGGDKSKVTIWGESAGSFAVGQLLLSYNGQTDGLFHRTIQESGSATTAWYNGSDWYQPIYDKIVSEVNCADAIDTLACLRTIPYAELYPFLNSSIVGGPGFYPVVDGDVIPNYPTIMLDEGNFAHVPHLYGTNSDEGTANTPADGVINTDEDLRWYISTQTGWGFPNSTITEIMRLYPDDPAQGIPLNTGTERFASHGYQYKRAAAITGDVFYHATRLFDARAYAKYDDTYIYRFNTRAWQNNTNATYTDYTGSLDPAYKGVSHYSEVAFVFNNPAFVGPWEGHQALSDQMSAQWINFVHGGDPHGVDLPVWPRYGKGVGKNLVLQTEGQGGSYVEDDTYRLEGREYLIKWARRRHV